jgi:predicted aspartyl protease
VSVKTGPVVNGHPYIEILLSPDGKTRTKFTALIDTGFSGFASVPVMTASLPGLKAHATACYTLADGKVSDPVPLAYGYACIGGDKFVQGLISISEHSSTVVGVDFLTRCGKALMLTPKGVIIITETELLQALELMAKLEAEDEKKSKSD